jgi:hypothetical protein
MDRVTGITGDSIVLEQSMVEDSDTLIVHCIADFP